MLERFERALQRCAGEDFSSVLVALSGGADSTALLLLFAALHDKTRERPIRVEAYHLHHGIRGEEADRDLAFCEDLCKKHGVILHVGRANVPAEAKKRRIGVEECGRILRYEALERIANERGLQWIATAHNAGDQLETVLFRAARGSGLRGLCGIPERRGRIIRPLLTFTKEELEAYCRENGEEYMLDSSNGEDLYTRNALRHKVVPELEKLCPGAVQNIARLTESLSEDEAYLTSLLPDEKASLQTLRELPPPLLKRWLADRYRAYCAKSGAAGELEYKHINSLADLVRKGETGEMLSLPGGVRATLGRDALAFSKDRVEKSVYAVVPTREKTSFCDGMWSVYLTDERRFAEISTKNKKVHKLFKKIAIESATIEGELVMRGREPRDKVYFGGMTREVSKLAAAVTGDPYKRKNYPVLCDGKGVLWVPGYPARGQEKGNVTGAQTSEKIYIVLEEEKDELP